MAGIMIDALYSDLVEPTLMDRFRKAMHVATRGNIPRKKGFHGDDMGPCYSNPFLMRCLCSTYIGKLMGDQELWDLSEVEHISSFGDQGLTGRAGPRRRLRCGRSTTRPESSTRRHMLG
jgi:hypothetical protein